MNDQFYFIMVYVKLAISNTQRVRVM